MEGPLGDYRKLIQLEAKQLPQARVEGLELAPHRQEELDRQKVMEPALGSTRKR